MAGLFTWFWNLFRPRPAPLPPPPGPTPDPPLDGSAASLLAAHNAVRATYRLPSLAADASLQRAAVEWATTMARYNRMFGHDDSPDGRSWAFRLADAGWPSGRWAAENEAAGQADVAAVMKVWESSSGHMKNIIDPAYRSFGGASARSAAGIRYWVCELGS